MGLAKNKAISNRVTAAINVRDLDALDELMAPELAESFKQGMREFYKAFPDYHGINEEQIAEGNKVVNRWMFTGTHSGDYLGLPPTGKTITFRGISIDTIVKGKLVSTYIVTDDLEVLRRMGLGVVEGLELTLESPAGL